MTVARRNPLVLAGRELWPVLRRTALTILGVQLVLAISLTLVDSWRRRGKKPQPFPTLPPQDVQIGTGTVTTYTYGADLYDDMLTAIEGARSQVLFETYIWKGDETGERFKEALTAAADRGVEVYAIYDAFANIVVDPRFKTFSKVLRVLKYPIYNAGWRFFDIRRYGRDHRKVLVVDDSVAFVGGFNIGAPYATEWRDTHCRITGPAVWDLKRSFADFWNDHRSGRRPLLLETADAEWEPRIRLHRNLPRQWMFPIRSMYLEAINRARRNIWMTHAYFIPDQDFVDSLVGAARRGVDVQILLPRTSNHVVADWISRGYFGQLLDAGVKIHRFEGAMVHAKTATIDGKWSTVGTANIDRLSMSGNYEINVEFIDPGMAKVMEEIFRSDLEQCSHLAPRDWNARGIHRRFTEAVLNPLRHLL
ncbi:cardiolipin synthase [Marmoricola sp. OAE513]|uniref:phospholipase D-like domain-containing protein n=1 Tax=Marmoricola sp. OAE513 TaxID=2817894 RepID=UPI001D46882B